MSSERTLIRGGTVITMEPGVAHGGADILIDGDQIVAVGKDLAVAEGTARVVDAFNRIIIPGFVDTHRHVHQILLRGLASNWSLMEYLPGVTATLGPNFTPEDCYLAQRFGALDAIDTGVTAVFDWCQEQLTPEHTDALLAGLESAALRVNFGSGANAINMQAALKPPFINSIPANAAEVRRLRNRYPSDTSLLTIGMAGAGPDHLTMDAVEQDFALA